MANHWHMCHNWHTETILVDMRNISLQKKSIIMLCNIMVTQSAIHNSCR